MICRPGRSRQRPGGLNVGGGGLLREAMQENHPEALKGEEPRLPAPIKLHTPFCSERLWSFPA